MNQFRYAYALITPARNEEEHIEKAIRSVISQTLLPIRWIIVSDGSVDRTDQIVAKYLERYAWMELIRMPEHSERHFSAKVQCFNAGYKRLKDIKFDIIGNLDADASFDEGYFEYFVRQFHRYSDLGVAGSPFVEEAASAYDYRFTNIEHVSGICQLFRRKCFEDIGGYVPISGGGIDWVAVTTARMKGWKTRTFTEQIILHHRAIGTGSVGLLKSRYRLGKKDYNLGNHPLWEIFRVLYQSFKGRPRILSGFLMLCGFVSGLFKREERPISSALVEFIQREQLRRLSDRVLRVLGIRKTTSES